MICNRNARPAGAGRAFQFEAVWGLGQQLFQSLERDFAGFHGGFTVGVDFLFQGDPVRAADSTAGFDDFGPVDRVLAEEGLFAGFIVHHRGFEVGAAEAAGVAFHHFDRVKAGGCPADVLLKDDVLCRVLGEEVVVGFTV